MEAVEVKLEDILSCKEIPIVRLKSYAINAFVMGYHVYKKNWTPPIGDELQGLMEPTNKLIIKSNKKSNYRESAV